MSEISESSDAAAELVQRALQEFEGPLIGYAASILGGDVERGRDAVQDTFLKLYRQRPENVRQALKSWLYTVCRNRCLDILRKERRMTTIDEEQIEAISSTEQDPAEIAEREEAHEAVLRQLDRLPPNQREVIRLKFQSDLSYREISEITSLSVSNVGYLIHTGIKQLRRQMTRQTA